MTALRKQVDQATMDAWGELSGDLNPLHVDPAYAATTRYGGTILHGHLTIAWLSEWALRRWGAPWLALGSIADLRFRAPLRPGVAYAVEGVAGEAGDVGLAVRLPDGSAAVTATARLREGAEAAQAPTLREGAEAAQATTPRGGAEAT